MRIKIKNWKDNPSIQVRDQISSRGNQYVGFVENDEDETFIEYCLVCNSRINVDNDVILQNISM